MGPLYLRPTVEAVKYRTIIYYTLKSKNMRNRKTFIIIALVVIAILSIIIILEKKNKEELKQEEHRQGGIVNNIENIQEVNKVNTQKNDCDAEYQKMISVISQNYSECVPPNANLDECGLGNNKETFEEILAIELILDSSGSMAGFVGNETKMTAAKSAITNFINNIPEEANVGLRVYGHKGSNSENDKTISCQSSELIYPIQPLDVDKFTDAVNSFSPTGWTPIATSLTLAADDLKKFPSKSTTSVIYLVSDGVETCDGNPLQAATDLKSQNINAIINVIGFDVDQVAQKQLKQIADATGGEYFDAKNGDQLRQIFDSSIKDLRERQQYSLCILRSEQQYRLENVREFQQYNLCVERKSSREKLDGQAYISKLQDEFANTTCKKQMRTLLEERKKYINLEAEKSIDIDKILKESKERETTQRGELLP